MRCGTKRCSNDLSRLRPDVPSPELLLGEQPVPADEIRAEGYADHANAQCCSDRSTIKVYQAGRYAPAEKRAPARRDRGGWPTADAEPSH